MDDAAFAWAAAQLPDRSGVTFTPLKAEASFRSFFRVADRGDGEPVVLMVSPPEKERNDQFETLSRVFCDAGIPVPDILARDPDRGFYVLRDVGARDLESLYGGPWEAAALEAAIETLIRLQTVHHPAIAPYTLERLEDELGIFEEWFATALLSSAIPDPVGRVFRLLVEHAAAQPQCCVHRDYHCRNLLFAPDTGRLGVVDFQDALIG
ncbi:MAG: phosphotransferase, partial [Pseudomonadales bacterium]